MSDLRSTITQLSEAFAQEILRTVRRLSLDELASVHGAPRRVAVPRARGRHRRSESDLKTAAVHVAGVVHGTGKHGVQTHEIVKATGMPRQVVLRALGDALKAKTITKKGRRRSTTYFGV